MKKKKKNLILSIGWFAVSAVWIVTMCMNAIAGTAPGFLIALQCACILVSCANAVVNLIRYNRSGEIIDRR